MIPPFLASLGGKVALGLLSAAVIAGAIYAYNERLRSQGDLRTEAKHQEQVNEQTAHVQAHDQALAASQLEGLERMLAEKDAFNAAMLRENKQLKAKLGTAPKIITKEPEVIHDVDYITIEKAVDRPVPTPCVVPEDLVERVDYLAGVLNEIPYHRVPRGTETDEERALSGLSPIACATLVARIETLTSRLGNTLIKFRNLSWKAVNQYELYERWKGQVYSKELPEDK